MHLNLFQHNNNLLNVKQNNTLYKAVIKQNNKAAVIYKTIIRRFIVVARVLTGLYKKINQDVSK
jgi:hypothetical protein